MVSPIGAGGDGGLPRALSEMLAVGEEAELVGRRRGAKAPSAKRQKVSRANRIHPDAPEILGSPDHRAPTLTDKDEGGFGPDPRHPTQELIGRGTDLQRKLL